MLTEDIDKVMDRDAFLERVGGDEELAQELVTLLLRDLPRLTEAVQTAVVGKQSTDLERSAHALKGAVANFSAPGAVSAAATLESMGRAGNLLGCEDAHVALQVEVKRLAEVLPRLFNRAPSS